jgi:hypothetical protein
VFTASAPSATSPTDPQMATRMPMKSATLLVLEATVSFLSMD